MATATEDMDTAAEPIMAKSEPKEEAPPLEPSPSLIDTKAEHIDQAFLPPSRSVSDMEVSVSPAVQTPAQPASPQDQSSLVPEQKGNESPTDRHLSVESTENSEEPKEQTELSEITEHIDIEQADPLHSVSDYNASINGNHQEENGFNEDNNEELTPPPESSPEPSESRVPSVQPNTLEDEIVVGTGANHNKSHINRTTPDPEDIVMGDVDEKPPTGQHSKRKRISAVYAESVDGIDDTPTPKEEPEIRRAGRPAKSGGMKDGKDGNSVIIGYWRDSPIEDDQDKHAVIGFIDVRDRLRTRIIAINRGGQDVSKMSPIPPGPGGSWVTFDKVAFDDHLVGLTHHVVKEYVKIRVENSHPDETPEEKAKLDRETAELAMERLRANPQPEPATGPLIAYGIEIPQNAVLPKPEAKRRRLLGQFATPSSSPGYSQHALEDIPGRRPTIVPVGVWKNSSEEDFLDKHVVHGVIGTNDMFRVKLIKETRDGRPVHGNFPTGAGGLWIHWDDVQFDSHLTNLSRLEMKEYCRVRQAQMDHGEAPEQRPANEAAAVIEAQNRVARSAALGIPIRKDDSDLPPIAMKGAVNGNFRDTSSPRGAALIAAKPDEPSHTPGPQNGTNRAGRRPLPEVQFGAANRGLPNASVLDRTNSLARREIARVEAAQARANQRAASREASLDPGSVVNNNGSPDAVHTNTGSTHTSQNKALFRDNVSRLNRVWAAQEANRLRAGDEDAKIYMGIKYERKQSGPFEGKLVSQGTIITIDGQDYVEYRVLTKPSFF